MKCFVFDLDGTLANCEHRLHHIQGEKKDWRAFFAACKDDAPIGPMLELYGALRTTMWFTSRRPDCRPYLRRDNHGRVIVSGRSDECRAETQHWLTHIAGVNFDALYMRKAGDHRPDDVVKSELLDQMLAEGWNPILFIDDRKRVVDMWRDRGFMCLQCAPGEF